MQSTNTAAYIGNIVLHGEVNTFMDQTYRSNTLTADPIAPLNTVTFTVDDINAKISFDLYKDVLTNDYSFTNTDGAAAMILNGPTTFNGLKATPTFPTGKWSSVTMGMSLAALAASRMGGPAEPGKATTASSVATPNVPVAPLMPTIAPINRQAIDGGVTMATMMNNNNFEVPKSNASGNVFVSMGSPAKSADSEDYDRDDRVKDKALPDLEQENIVIDDRLRRSKDDGTCAKEGASCAE
jgi:hypothetical protein